MKCTKWEMGDFGASTRPISFAPKIKANKERLLKKFREDLGRKGYSPAEASQIAEKVRTEANGLALEVNARQGNDDRVRMANIHTMALKMMIKKTLKTIPSKSKAMSGEYLGRISKNSPMTALADRAKAYDTHIIKRRAERRDNKRERAVAQRDAYRERRGKLKDDILNEVKRASYMTQFNGALGHYGMGKPKWLKKVQKAASKAAAPIQKVAAKVAAPVAKVAAKVAAPIKQAATYVAKKTVQAVKAVGSFLKKILDKLKELIKKALQPIINFFKKAWEGIKKVIIDKVAARFTGKGTAGFGSLPQDEQKKIVDLTTTFVTKKTAEALGVQGTIFGTAAAAATTTATATVTAAAAAGGPAAPATAAAAAPAAATAAAATATPTATAATTAYITKLTGEGVQDISTEFAKYKTQKAIPNPALRAIVNAGIDGKIPTDKESIMKAASNLPAQAQAELVKKVQSAPEAMKQEILKKALVPQEFKKVVNFLPKEANALAEVKSAIPQLSIAESMQKAYVANPNIIAPAVIEAKAIAAQGVIAQDQKAASMVRENKLSPVQAIAASSKIGKEQAIAQLPPEQRQKMVQEVKKEMSNVEVARIDQKVADEKSKSNTALLTAAAIAAKVLLF